MKNLPPAALHLTEALRLLVTSDHAKEEFMQDAIKHIRRTQEILRAMSPEKYLK